MYDCNSLNTGISRTNRINLKFVLKQSQLQVSFKLSHVGERDNDVCFTLQAPDRTIQ